MLKAALVRRDGIPVEVGDLCDARMACLAMVALEDGQLQTLSLVWLRLTSL